MSKFKINHGVSRIRRAKLQASIDQSIAEDIQLLAEWSNNEPQYIVNQLLRFALAQEEEFQKHKAGVSANPSRSATGAKSASSTAKSTSSAAKPMSDPGSKSDAPTQA